MIQLRPVREGDAELLHPRIAGTAVTDTLLWDGPASLDDYRSALALFAAAKNGYRLEGTRRRAARKRGRLLDEWRLGIVPEDLPG